MSFFQTNFKDLKILKNVFASKNGCLIVPKP